MELLKKLRWPGIVLLTVLYIIFKVMGIGGNIINIFSIGLAGIILTLPLEEKVYTSFFFIQGFLYFFVFSFAFYNVIVLMILGHMLLMKKHFPRLNIIILSGILLAYEIVLHVVYSNMEISYLVKWVLAFFVSISLMQNNVIKFDKCKAIFLYALGSTFIEVGTLLGNNGLLSSSIYDRFEGGMGTLNNNTFSLYCLFCVSLCVYVLCDKRAQKNSPFYQKYKRIMPILLIAFAGIALFVGASMLSKAYFLVAIIWAMILFLFNAKYKKRAILLFLIAVVSVIAIFSIPTTRELVNGVIARFGGLNDINTITTGRTEILLRYITKLRNDPIKLFFGTGLFTYTEVFNIGIYTGQNTNYVTHNVILEIICGYGLVGFSILLWVYLKAFIKDSKNKFYKDFNRFIPLIVFLVFGLSLSLYREDVTHFIILLCLVVCRSDLSNNISDKAQTDAEIDTTSDIESKELFFQKP